MKKLLLALFAAVLTATSFAAETYKFNNKWFNFTAEDKAFLDAQTNPKYTRFKLAMNLEEYGKTNPAVYTDLEEFKKFISTQKYFKIDDFNNAYNICLVILTLRQKFSENLLTKYYEISNVNICKIYWPIYLTDMTAAKFFNGSKLKALMNSAQNTVSTVHVTHLLNAIERKLVNENPEDVLAILKTIKRKHYSKIKNSDDWKKIMVRVELLIKSLQ